MHTFLLKHLQFAGYALLFATLMLTVLFKDLYVTEVCFIFDFWYSDQGYENIIICLILITLNIKGHSD
jgi:hypothetical protein